MRSLCRAIRVFLIGVCTLSLGNLAEGAIQNVTISGSILTADAGNLFGLNVGDPISLQALFDDSVYTSFGYIPFDSSTTNDFSMNLGLMQLSGANDIDFYDPYPAFPRLILCEDPLLSVYRIDYFTTLGENGAPVDYMNISRTQFLAVDANGATITGEWVLSNCPEPSTFVLAGMAVTGMVVRRRRRAL